MKTLEKKFNIQKSEYQGKKNYEGNQLKKILDNIPIIQEIVPKEFHPLIDAFSALKELKMATYGQRLNYCSPRPAPYYRNVVKNVERKWNKINEQFKTSLTPKIHAIIDHIPDYIEEKGIALGKTSDQLIEATHQQHNKLFNRSGYFVKVLNSPAHKSRLEKGVHHYNSYHV